MSPSFDIAGFSASLMAEYAPEASDAAVTDGGVSTSSNLWSSGQGLGVKVSGMGISAGAYANELTKDEVHAGGARRRRNECYLAC